MRSKFIKLSISHLALLLVFLINLNIASAATNPPGQWEPNWTRALVKTPTGMGRTCCGTVFNGKMWVIATTTPTVASSDVWSSPDGISWTREASNVGSSNLAVETARQGQTMVAFNGKLWFFGGFTSSWLDTSSYSYKNDIWSSDDGKTWTRVVASAPWSVRTFPTVTIFNNKIWLMGGMTTGGWTLNDVWTSSDGTTWTQVSASSPWATRQGAGAVVFQNKIWLVGGGWTEGCYGGCYKDVWTTTDGISWTKETITAAVWPGRANFALEVYDNKMWIANGLISDFPGCPIGAYCWINDIQYSRDGKNWVLTYDWFTSTGKTPWQGNNARSPFIVFNNRIWMIADPTTASGDESSVYYTTGEIIDIGIRVYDGTGIVHIAAEPLGTLTSPLRIAKNGNIYGIALVDPSDPTASRIRIKTSSGIKALKRI